MLDFQKKYGEDLLKRSEEIPSPTKIEFDKVVHDEKVKTIS